MAIVGSAEVIIRAIGDKLEGDIQRALNNAARNSRSSSGRAGDEMGNTMGEHASAALQRALNDGGIELNTAPIADKASKDLAENFDTKPLDKKLSHEGEGIGNNFGKSIGRGIDRSRGGRGFASIAVKLGVLIPIIGAVVGAISTLASGLFAMISTMGTAANASVALAGSLTALVSGFIATKVATLGVGKAIQEGFKADNAKKFEEALKKIAPAARPFVKELVGMKGELTQIRNKAAQGLFPGLQSALARIKPFLGGIGDGFKVLGEAVGSAADSMAKSFTTSTFRSSLKELTGFNAIAIKDMGAAVGDLGSAFTSLLAAAGPLTTRFTGFFKGFSSDLRKSVEEGKKTGKLGDYFTKAGDAAAQMGRIISNIAQGLFDFGQVAGPTGKRLFDAFEKVTQKFSEFTDSGKNVQTLQKHFKGVGDNMLAISRLAADLGKAFLRIGASPGIAKTAEAFRKIIPDLEKAITTGVAEIGPKIAVLVGEFAKLFTALSQSGVVSVVINIFTGLAKAINFLFNSPLRPLIALIAKLAAAFLALKLITKLGGAVFSPFVTGVNRAAGAANNMINSGQTLARTQRNLKTSFAASNAGILAFGGSAQRSGRWALGLGKNIQNTGIQFGKFGNTVPVIGTKLDGAGAKGLTAAGRFGKLGTTFGRLASVVKPSIAGTIVGLGASALGASGKMDKFSASLAGVSIGGLIGGLPGAAIGGAIGGVVDLGRALLGTGDKGKKATANIKAGMVGLSAVTKEAVSSIGKADNYKALDVATKKLAALRAARAHQIQIGGNTTELDKAISSAEKNIAKLQASVSKDTNNFGIKIDFAQARSDFKVFTGEFKSVVSAIEQGTGKKFKFDIDSGPFQQASRDMYTSLQNLATAAANVGPSGITRFRSDLQNLSGTLGISEKAATILANKLTGFPQLLAGIPNSKTFVLDADTKSALRKFGFVKSDFDRLQAEISGKPIKFDISTNGADAKAGITGVAQALEGLPPSTPVSIKTNKFGTIVTEAGQLQAALDAVPPAVPVNINGKGFPRVLSDAERTDAALQILNDTQYLATLDAKVGGGFPGAISGATGQLQGFEQLDPMAQLGAQVAPSLPSAVASGSKQASGFAQPYFAPLGGLVDPSLGGALAQAEGPLNTFANTPYQAPVSAVTAPGFSFFGFLAKLLPKAPQQVPVQATLDMGSVSAVANKIAGLKPTVIARGTIDGGGLTTIANRIAGLKPTVTARGTIDGGGLTTIANRIAGLKPTVTARGNIDGGGLTTIANKIAGLKPTVTANTKANVAGLVSGINSVKGKSVTVNTRANTSGASKAIAGIKGKAVTVTTKANTSGASRAISGIKAKTVTVNTKGNTSSAQGAINRIKAKTVNVPVKASTGSAQGAINAIHGKTVYIRVVKTGATGVSTGGLIRGPGTPTSDSIPAMLSDGEFVIRAAQARKYLSVLRSINTGAGIPLKTSLSAPVPLPMVNLGSSSSPPIATKSGASVQYLVGELTLTSDSKVMLRGVSEEVFNGNVEFNNSVKRMN